MIKLAPTACGEGKNSGDTHCKLVTVNQTRNAIATATPETTLGFIQNCRHPLSARQPDRLRRISFRTPIPVSFVGEWGVGSGEWGVGSREWGVGERRIYPSTHPLIHSSTHPPIHLSTHPPIHPSL
ncbi:MAG: hypothetical protein MUF49_20920 [Oculatellaceae cyanobacterium Prado106]|nr:hypothetical protein [Oculatellaceae cyanobacterium Prado106]